MAFPVLGVIYFVNYGNYYGKNEQMSYFEKHYVKKRMSGSFNWKCSRKPNQMFMNGHEEAPISSERFK